MRGFLERSCHRYLLEGERHITETCLDYLAAAVSGVSQDVTERARGSPWRNDVWAQYCQDHDFALCAYIAKYWGDHARVIDEFSLDAIARFFKHPISPYISNEYAPHIDITGTASELPPEHYWILYLARFGLLTVLQKHTDALQSKNSLQKESINYNHIRDGDGRTALHLSAWGGHSTIVNFLLDSGAHANQQTDHGDSPLHCALQAHTGSYSVATVQLLLDRGANVDQPNCVGRAPISYAIEQLWTSNAPSLDIIHLLLHHEVDIYRVDEFSNTPLSLAQKSEHPEITQLVEEYARTHPQAPKRRPYKQRFPKS